MKRIEADLRILKLQVCFTPICSKKEKLVIMLSLKTYLHTFIQANFESGVVCTILFTLQLDCNYNIMLRMPAEFIMRQQIPQTLSNAVNNPVFILYLDLTNWPVLSP